MGTCQSKKDSSLIITKKGRDQAFISIDGKPIRSKMSTFTQDQDNLQQQKPKMIEQGPPQSQSEQPQKDQPTILDVKMKKGETVMQNFLIDLTEIANTEGINKNETSTLTQVQSNQTNQSNKKKAQNLLVSAKVTSESEYKYIPNNFKKNEGVAFKVATSKINFEAGISGLHNMGNTCFFSSSVQCLSAVQPLTDFFLGELHLATLNKTNPMGSGGNVTLEFSRLIQQMWNGKEDKIYPQDMYKVLQKYASHLFSGYQQQDAQEFLAYFLDILHEDLNRADKLANMQQRKAKESKDFTSLGNRSILEEDSLDPQGMNEEQQELKACEAWKDHLFNNRSIIVDLFQGQLKSTLECLKCHYVSLKFDSFMYLSVPIPQDKKDPTLQDCIYEFTKEEILDGEDKWKCPKCKSFQKAKKKIDIWKLPSVLIVHLKRFEFTERKSGKIRDLIDFPLKNLDLAPYVSAMRKDQPIYDLFATMNHEGFMGGGHYYSCTKHRQSQLWYEFNDEVVTKIRRDEKIVNADAYILFYSKMSVDEFCRQTLREPSLWPHIYNTEMSTISRIDITQQTKDNYSSLLRNVTDVNQQRVRFKDDKILGASYAPMNTMEYEDGLRQQSMSNTFNPKSNVTPLKKAPSTYDTPYFSYNNSTIPNDISRKQTTSTDLQYQGSLVSDIKRPNMLSASAYTIGGATQQKKTQFHSLGQMITTSQSQNKLAGNANTNQLKTVKEEGSFVINNNSNNYFINLYMKKE